MKVDNKYKLVLQTPKLWMFEYFIGKCSNANLSENYVLSDDHVFYMLWYLQALTPPLPLYPPNAAPIVPGLAPILPDPNAIAAANKAAARIQEQGIICWIRLESLMGLIHTVWCLLLQLRRWLLPSLLHLQCLLSLNQNVSSTIGCCDIHKLTCIYHSKQ